MNKIIVLQNAVHGGFFFRVFLRKNNLNKEDFDIHEIPERCEEAVIPNAPQLLILGSIDGRSEEATKFIQRMREKNPAIKIIGFSSLKKEIGGCDFFIDRKKDNSSKLLAQTIREMIPQLVT